ncbi:GyrI-like domain-containing protein [Candidatus Lokiarchaeum ossiferum]|uniref:GyrI-like domain-containing protein n=1 Tax=Candidatus Lokiarchaeum ossiferum TaxID=2951803 RepID=UPI00352D1E44
MNKRKIGRFHPLPVVPIVLVGAMVNGKPNFLTVGCVGAVNMKPPILMVSLNKSHYSLIGIKKNRTFSINIPSAENVIETDYCGLVSGKSYDKSKIFTTFYGDLQTAPMIEECPITCECKLLDTKEFAQDIAFFGEISQVYANEEVSRTKKIDLLKVNPIFLSGFENLYRSTAESHILGRCYKIGEQYRCTQKLLGPKICIRGPTVVEKDEFQIIGIEDIDTVEDRNPGEVWAKFQQFAPLIPNRDQSHGLGIYMETEELMKEGKNRYVVGNEIATVEKIPKGMISETIPKQKYAVFTHVGTMANLQQTYDYINEQWHPDKPLYEKTPFGVIIEWYDQRFRRDSEYSELDLYIPIQKKKT